MANDLKFGNKTIKDMFFGNKTVKAIYLGTTLVWEKNTSYVKYHLRFEWSGNNTLALLETLIDGTTAGNRLVDGGRFQDPDWYIIEDAKIASLRNATQTGFYGTIVELNFNATNISSIGFRTDPYYVDQSTFKLKVIGEDSAGNKTTLHEENMSVSTGQTYTFNI